MAARFLSDNQGFSLVEALIASTILATAIVSLAQLLVSGATATADAGRITRAALLAAEKIEQLRAMPPDVAGMIAADTPEPGVVREWTISALPADPVSLVLADVVVRSASGSTLTRMFAVLPRPQP